MCSHVLAEYQELAPALSLTFWPLTTVINCHVSGPATLSLIGAETVDIVVYLELPTGVLCVLHWS